MIVYNLKIVFVFIVAATAAMEAASEGLYIQGDLGIDYYAPNEQNGANFDIQPGLSLGARVGKSFASFRGEAEVGVGLSTIDHGADVGEDDFDYYQLSISAGAYKDIRPFYVGVGAGLVQQEVEAEVFGVEISDSDTNFLIYGEAGIAIMINDAFDLVPHYRATWLPGFDLDDEVIVHSARLGIRYRI